MDYRNRFYEQYKSTRWADIHSNDPREYDLYTRSAAIRWKPLLPENRDALILDVAAGAGHFLYCLDRLGYTRAKGIDLCEDQVESARQVGVKNIEQGNLFDLLSQSDSAYDMIVANDIIEHFTKTEILEFLEKILKALKPGGNVVISTLNAESPFGAGSRYCDFTHETGFTSGSLAQVLRVIGYENVRIIGDKPVSHDFRSSIRTAAWWCISKCLSSYLLVARGSGRGVWQHKMIFEERIFGVGVRPLT